MTTDQAVEALKAAGDSIPKLEAAIEAASFLDAIPGDDRQMLRGLPAIPPQCASPTLSNAAARKRLRDARRAAAAESEQRAAQDAANRSPHTKASYDAAEFAGLCTRYDSLKWRLIQKPGGAAVRPDEY